MSARPVHRQVGSNALLVELAAADVASTYAQIRKLVEDGTLPPARDVVPAARTILVDGVEPVGWWDAFRAVGPPDPSARAGSGREVVIALTYDGEDLDDVAEQWGCDRDEVVRRHLEAEYTVAFCGFAPGFAYCVTDDGLPEVRRRDDPRTKVPAGSVGLAGPYCGIYPTAMPAGWQLIGRTSETMFDPKRSQPALLSPGDTVRFTRAD